MVSKMEFGGMSVTIFNFVFKYFVLEYIWIHN